SLPGLAETLRPGIENVSAVLSSIDQAAVEAIVADVRTLSGTLAAEAPRVEQIIGRVDTVTADVAVITARLRGELDGVSAGLADARAALADARTFASGLPELLTTLEPGVTNVSNALQAVDPAAIDAII